MGSMFIQQILNSTTVLGSKPIKRWSWFTHRFKVTDVFLEMWVDTYEDLSKLYVWRQTKRSTVCPSSCMDSLIVCCTSNECNRSLTLMGLAGFLTSWSTIIVHLLFHSHAFRVKECEACLHAFKWWRFIIYKVYIQRFLVEYGNTTTLLADLGICLNLYPIYHLMSLIKVTLMNPNLRQTKHVNIVISYIINYLTSFVLSGSPVD